LTGLKLMINRYWF